MEGVVVRVIEKSDKTLFGYGKLYKVRDSGNMIVRGEVFGADQLPRGVGRSGVEYMRDHMRMVGAEKDIVRVSKPVGGTVLGPVELWHKVRVEEEVVADFVRVGLFGAGSVSQYVDLKV
ncbi:capsule biosynthesis GfcC family protein [Escherichia coli]|nr:capsule biosynthesis GfcC family protein [Escherichia coli]WCE52620.1 capsule biosynthesis GfcC family protein [Escherichia coli]